MLCPEAFDKGDMGCIDPAGAENHEPGCHGRLCGFQHIWSKGLRQELVDNEGQLKEGVNPIWLQEMKWDRFKTNDSSNVEKETLMNERSGSILEFMDEFEPVFAKYACHRYILHRPKISNKEFERNAYPGTLKLDVDFAENFTMIHAREIQSQYWNMKQATLFVCIGKVLCQVDWDAREGELKEGAEVTVESTNEQHGPFWAEVVNAQGPNGEYTVRDAASASHVVLRSQLRARVWYTVAQIGVSNDKRHDSYATQHFLNEMIKQWLVTDHRQFGITSVHIHSDNAGQHFKNSRTLHYLSTLKAELGMKVTWSFGCPGHGKGPWDGLGGLMKRVLRSETIKLKVVLRTYQDVAAYLRLRFCNEDWLQKHKVGTGYKINCVKITEVDSNQIKRDENEIYESIYSLRKSFGYMALTKGKVLQRWFDCWCRNCMRATEPGEGTMNSNYQINQCLLSEPYYECSVQLQGTRGVIAQRKAAQAKGRDLARHLQPGTFVAFQDRENQNDSVPFMIGITIDYGNGTCIIQDMFTERTYLNGTRFDEGDCAIAVRWLQRLSEDPEQRTFEYHVNDTAEVSVLNSTELRHTNIELELVPPMGATLRRSNRSVPRGHTAGSRKYSLPVAIEQAILNDCW